MRKENNTHVKQVAIRLLAKYKHKKCAYLQ